jgi:hypothetical protein
MTYRWDTDWMIEFIDTSYKPLGAKGNHSAKANLRTLQFTAANSRVPNLH